jgi:hypothetical protein
MIEFLHSILQRIIVALNRRARNRIVGIACIADTPKQTLYSVVTETPKKRIREDIIRCRISQP